MSNVKPFYLTKFSICPKCGGEKLEHMKTKGIGAKFICNNPECNQGFDFSDYIKQALISAEREPFMKVFEALYYEVNKPR